MNEEQINEAMRLGELWATYAWKACSHGADETVKSQAGRAALEAYLRTVGEPESVNAELLEALKYARHCIGIDRDTLVDCHTNPCTGYLDPDGALAKAEYDDVIDAADAAIARAESAIESSPKPVSPDLLESARAVVARWDAPTWKDLPATAEYIGRLRVAIAQADLDGALTAEEWVIGQWRRGERAIPQPVQDWMLRACIAYAIGQCGGISPSADADLDRLAAMLCPPVRGS